MTSRPELRPLRVGETIDMAVRVVRHTFRAMLAIGAAVWLPVAVLGLFASFALAESVEMYFGDPTFFYASEEDFDRAETIAWILLPLRSVASLVAVAAMVRVAARHYIDGETTGLGNAVGYGFRRLGSILWIGLLVVLVLFAAGIVAGIIGLALLLLGSIAWLAFSLWLVVRWAVALPALIVEDERGSSALSRSFGLVKGRWWPVFGALLIAVVVEVALALGVSALVLGLIEFDSAALVVTLGTALTWAINLVVFPFFAAVQVVIYFDLRVRKEGFDLELMEQGLADAGPPPPAAPYEAPPVSPSPYPAPPPAPPPPRDLPPSPPTAPTGTDDSWGTCMACGRTIAASSERCPYCLAPTTGTGPERDPAPG